MCAAINLTAFSVTDDVRALLTDDTLNLQRAPVAFPGVVGVCFVCGNFVNLSVSLFVCLSHCFEDEVGACSVVVSDRRVSSTPEASASTSTKICNVM